MAKTAKTDWVQPLKCSSDFKIAFQNVVNKLGVNKADFQRRALAFFLLRHDSVLSAADIITIKAELEIPNLLNDELDQLLFTLPAERPDSV